MNCLVKLLPSEKEYLCEADETILSAALRAGIILPYGCKNGACGSCKSRLLEGKVQHGAHQARALSEEEEAQGLVLTCCAKPLGPLSLQVRELQGVGDIPVRKMPCRVQSLHKPIASVAVLHVQLPANDALQFSAGQYVEFLLRDGSRRSYSIANAPHVQGHLEFHIRHMPGGLFTDQVFSTLKERDILRFEGPFGSFFLRDQSTKPVVLLASGTGFAPIKAILEHALHQGSQREFVLYWGARQEEDLYALELAQSWQGSGLNYRFVPVLSDVPTDAVWAGRRGLVHQAVMQDLPNLSAYQVYACGAPVMLDAARRDFTQTCGLPEEEFFADAFTSMADTGAGKPPLSVSHIPLPAQQLR